MVDLRRRGPRGRLGHGHHPVLQRQGRPSAFNADTFRILKDTKHPDEAFEVLTYLLGEAPPTCSRRTAACPPATAEQAAFFDGQDETFTQKLDWQVAIDSIQFADNPNFEAFMPAYNETLGLVGSGGKYTTKWQTDQGLDMDAGDRGAARRDPGDLGQAVGPARRR